MGFAAITKGMTSRIGNGARSIRTESGNMKRLTNSYVIYLVLMVFLMLVHLLVTHVFAGQFRSVEQGKVFELQFVALWTAAGLAGGWVSKRTGFPEMIDERVSQRQRFLYPVGIGLGFGALAVWVDRSTGWATALASRMGQDSIHIPFPASALIYPAGSIVVEVIYRLLPV